MVRGTEQVYTGTSRAPVLASALASSVSLDGVSPPLSASPSTSRSPREEHEITSTCPLSPGPASSRRWELASPLRRRPDGSLGYEQGPARSRGTHRVKRGPSPHRRARKGALLYLPSSFPLLFSSQAPLQPPSVPGGGEGGRGEGRKREGRGRRGLGAGEAWGSLTSPQCLKAAAPARSIRLKMQNRGQTGLPPDALSAVLCLPLLGSASNNRGHREGQQP